MRLGGLGHLPVGPQCPPTPSPGLCVASSAQPTTAPSADGETEAQPRVPAPLNRPCPGRRPGGEGPPAGCQPMSTGAQTPARLPPLPGPAPAFLHLWAGEGLSHSSRVPAPTLPGRRGLQPRRTPAGLPRPPAGAWPVTLNPPPPSGPLSSCLCEGPTGSLGCRWPGWISMSMGRAAPGKLVNKPSPGRPP